MRFASALCTDADHTAVATLYYRIDDVVAAVFVKNPTAWWTHELDPENIEGPETFQLVEESQAHSSTLLRWTRPPKLQDLVDGPVSRATGVSHRRRRWVTVDERVPPSLPGLLPVTGSSYVVVCSH